MRALRTVNFLFSLPALTALVLVSAVACSGRDAGVPTQPGPSLLSPSLTASAPVSLTGTWAGTMVVNLAPGWSGTGSDSSGPGQMSWHVTQADTSFSGTVTFTDTGTGLGGRGSVSGTVSDTRINFLLTIPVGGFDSPFASCIAQVAGNGEVSTVLINAIYAGSNSCTGPIPWGQIKLDKQ
jgi:hypothetical protein